MKKTTFMGINHTPGAQIDSANIVVNVDMRDLVHAVDTLGQIMKSLNFSVQLPELNPKIEVKAGDVVVNVPELKTPNINVEVKAGDIATPTVNVEAKMPEEFKAMCSTAPVWPIYTAMMISVLSLCTLIFYILMQGIK